jgi:hypothetical protein
MKVGELGLAREPRGLGGKAGRLTYFGTPSNSAVVSKDDMSRQAATPVATLSAV